MLTESISEAEETEGYIDAVLENKARAHAAALASFVEEPSYSQLDILARSLRSLKWEMSNALPCYGTEYEHGGSKFIELAKETRKAIACLPEHIAQSEGDRSAHAAIKRYADEICAKVLEICGGPSSSTN